MDTSDEDSDGVDLDEEDFASSAEDSDTGSDEDDITELKLNTSTLTLHPTSDRYRQTHTGLNKHYADQSSEGLVSTKGLANQSDSGAFTSKASSATKAMKSLQQHGTQSESYWQNGKNKTEGSHQHTDPADMQTST
ncbi:MAG TPA: hypothetical protein V6C97_26940 [Oculatellaceae cyanobacterium]